MHIKRTPKAKSSYSAIFGIMGGKQLIDGTARPESPGIKRINTLLNIVNRYLHSLSNLIVLEFLLELFSNII